jgi:signal peptidase I
MLLLTPAILRDKQRPEWKKSAGLSPTWKQLAASVAIALALLVINDLFFFESVVIPTSSMRPTILPNERVLLRKIRYHTVHRFDIVVIANSATGKRLAKRIIGLPGDRIRLADSWKVYINDIPLVYKNESSSTLIESGHHLIAVESKSAVQIPTRFGKQDFLLGPDEYFVLGDNRLASDDSRQFGPIKRDEIQGKICLVWYSYDLQKRGLRLKRFLHIPQ